MNARDFVERFLTVQRELGTRTPLLPTAMVGAWRDFVDQCAQGYDEDIYEYSNDLSIRGLIDRVLRDERLAAMPELGWVRADVEETDRRFKELLLPVRIPSAALVHWWDAHPPRIAGPELADDFEAQYGIRITVVDG